MALIEIQNSTLAAIVDEEDKGVVSKVKWRISKGKNTVYAASTIDGEVVLMHRLILGAGNRQIHVDHKNGNGLDNRRENIRLCTPAQNNINRRLYRNNKSGLKGVMQHSNGRFAARITVNGKLKYIGSFGVAEDAARAYDEAAKIYHGEFANLNFG